MQLVLSLRRVKVWAVALAVLVLLGSSVVLTAPTAAEPAAEEKSIIRWVDFAPSYKAMARALELDINSHTKEGAVPLNWVELLACLGVKYGGNFSKYRESHLLSVKRRLEAGESIAQVTGGSKYYSYYFEAYNAVLGNFVGEYMREKPDPNNPDRNIFVTEYGLKVFHPLARGYGYSHYDDFGNSRSYGGRREHLGNDLMASIGTPVVAVEGGTVEAVGWNQYGGWRIGIRSLDKQRYYYYAHLRKGRPYNQGIAEGVVVEAGQVIGYLGMTGYSVKEDVNGMKVPHLHWGMQLIFDESQKEGSDEIWIDVYALVTLLEKRRSTVVKDPDSGEYERRYQLIPMNTAFDDRMGEGAEEG